MTDNTFLTILLSIAGLYAIAVLLTPLARALHSKRNKAIPDAYMRSLWEFQVLHANSTVLLALLLTTMKIVNEDMDFETLGFWSPLVIILASAAVVFALFLLVGLEYAEGGLMGKLRAVMFYAIGVMIAMGLAYVSPVGYVGGIKAHYTLALQVSSLVFFGAFTALLLHILTYAMVRAEPRDSQK